MIAVDTNVLARFYCDDPDDPESVKQRPRARKAMGGSSAIFVPVTVILELEWVMRGFYEVEPAAFCAAAGAGHAPDHPPADDRSRDRPARRSRSRYAHTAHSAAHARAAAGAEPHRHTARAWLHRDLRARARVGARRTRRDRSARARGAWGA